jgi:hypothetical protein
MEIGMEEQVIKVAHALFLARHPGDDWDINYGWYKKAMTSPEFVESQKVSPSHMMSAVFRDAAIAIDALKN